MRSDIACIFITRFLTPGMDNKHVQAGGIRQKACDERIFKNSEVYAMSNIALVLYLKSVQKIMQKQQEKDILSLSSKHAGLPKRTLRVACVQVPTRGTTQTFDFLKTICVAFCLPDLKFGPKLT